MNSKTLENGTCLCGKSFSKWAAGIEIQLTEATRLTLCHKCFNGIAEIGKYLVLLPASVNRKESKHEKTEDC